MIQFRNYTDAFGSETFIRNFSTDVSAVTLSAGVLQTVPVSSDAKMCIISGSDYWVSAVADFTIPVSAGVTTTTAVFEGAGFVLEGVTNLYFKSEASSKVTVEFYR